MTHLKIFKERFPLQASVFVVPINSSPQKPIASKTKQIKELEVGLGNIWLFYTFWLLF